MSRSEKIGADNLGAGGDDFYQALMDVHDGLSLDESTRLNARLVLLLANEVGDINRLREILKSAATSGASTGSNDANARRND